MSDTTMMAFYSASVKRILPLAWLFFHAQSVLVGAVQIITPDIAPADISTPCLNALTTNLTCGPMVPRFRYGYFYAPSTLESACTPECESDLASYETAVVSACSSDTWSGYDDEGDAPLGLIPSLVRFQYSLTCLQDSGRWCNVVAGEAAYLDDPGDSPGRFTEGPPEDDTPPDPCDLCFIKSLRIRAGVSYYDGPALVSQSIYESRTDNCSINGMPRTTSTLPVTVPTAPAVMPTPCAGDEYEIQLGDDCHSISLSEGIGTAWLLMDNNLAAWCENFPTEGALCLVNKCNVVTVQAGDSCHSIAYAANITDVQLKAWNLVLNAGCHNVDKLVGHQLCITPPGEEYVDPEPPTTTSTPVPVPTDVAEGTTERCAKYYLVQPGEYCNLLVMRFAISLADFLFLNPAINENCTNLFALESYCVQAYGDINTYPGKPGHASTTEEVSTLPFTSAIPTMTESAPAPIVTSTDPPLAQGTRDDCVEYFEGADFQNADAISGTTWTNQCQRVASLFGVAWADLNSWNADLANVTSSECGFDDTKRYCGKHSETFDQTEGPTVPELLPVREGAIEDCDEFANVDYGMTCIEVLTVYELTMEQFYEYNPAVEDDCSGLWPDMAYCIRGPGYTPPPSSTTSSAPPTSSTTTPATPTPPAPTHPGQPEDCDEWHVVESGDTCGSVASEYSLTLGEFLELNPAVSSDCVSNFWLGYAYCVGVAPVEVPSPVQEGNAHANCNAYAQAQSGDWCSAFADRNSISLSQLYEWNSVLGPEGSGCATSFWAGYWYCVGVSGD